MRITCWSSSLILVATLPIMAHPTIPDPPVPAVDTLVSDPESEQTLRAERVAPRRHLDRLGALGQAIYPTQVLTESALRRKNADNLAQALDGEPGISSTIGCSVCGIKRIQINGLSGEHTTVLIDGLPLHSTVSSYYGMDALTTAGLSRIEIARGPGASLIAPEAIGGTVDIRLRNPTGPSAAIDVAIGDCGWRRLALVGTARSDDGRLGVMGAGQFSGKGVQIDADDNGVNEAPKLDNRSAFIRLDGLVGDKLSWDMRVLQSSSEVFGGPVVEGGFGALTSTAPDQISFDGGDVRRRYSGNPLPIAEWIQTSREEIAGGLALEGALTWQLRGALARQIQDSKYGGSDYYNENITAVADLRGSFAVGDHTFVAGTNLKHETLESQSRAFYLEQGLIPDSFDSWFGGVYAQGVFELGPNRVLSAASRLDRVQVDWTFQGSGPELEEWIIAPRVHLKWEFLEGLTARLSGGQGWRPPLTFFESDHGLVENGFDVEITRLENAWGAGANLSLDRPHWAVAGSVYGTLLSGLAHVETEGVVRPTLRSYEGTLPFVSWDLQASVAPLHGLSVGVGYEQNVVPDRFKARSMLAAVESRVHARADVKHGPVNLGATLTWTPARDLLAYGYGDRWNVFDDADSDGEVDPGELRAPKKTESEDFILLDLNGSVRIIPGLEVYGGIENALDVTQVGSFGDSPLFWDSQGAMDVGHVWGPLHDRKAYFGVRVNL